MYSAKQQWQETINYHFLLFLFSILLPQHKDVLHQGTTSMPMFYLQLCLLHSHAHLLLFVRLTCRNYKHWFLHGNQQYQLYLSYHLLSFTKLDCLQEWCLSRFILVTASTSIIPFDYYRTLTSFNGICCSFNIHCYWLLMLSWVTPYALHNLYCSQFKSQGIVLFWSIFRACCVETLGTIKAKLPNLACDLLSISLTYHVISSVDCPR